METKTIQELQFIVAPDREQPALPPVTVTVAVARVICRPVERAEVVPVPHPERLCWAQFKPMVRPDPFLPVPLAEFGPELWERLRAWGQHYLDFSTRNVATWAAQGVGLVDSLAAFLASRYDEVGLTRAEAYWLTGALWQSYAQPQGARELLAADTALNRERRKAVHKARVKAYWRRQAEEAVLQYGGFTY